MNLLLLLIIVVVLFGGWGFYGNYGGRNYGWGWPGGGLIGVLILLLVLHLLGLF